MRRALTLAVLCLAATPLAFGQADAAKLEQNYKDKLAKEFAQKVAWTKTLDEAKQKAEAQNKLIFGYFTRSYSP